jgi:hypothetical protein
VDVITVSLLSRVAIDESATQSRCFTFHLASSFRESLPSGH